MKKTTAVIKPIPKSVLSLDVGRKRIGLAGCDPLGITISSLPAVQRKSFEEDLEMIENHCQSRNVKGLLIGLPLNDLGAPTKQSIYCEKYGKRIAKALGLPMAWINEHSTSWAAAQKYKLQNDRTGRLDSAAAALLLEQWLREGPELKPVQTPAYPIGQVN